MTWRYLLLYVWCALRDEHGGIGLDNLAVREFGAAQAVEIQHVADWVRRQWFSHPRRYQR